MAPHLSLLSWSGVIPAGDAAAADLWQLQEQIHPGLLVLGFPVCPTARVAPRQGFWDVRSPLGVAEAPGLKPDRLQVNLGICPAWTRSVFPSQKVLFASGQSFTVFRNKKHILKGKGIS